MRSMLVVGLVLALAGGGAVAEEEGFAFPSLDEAERVEERHYRLQMMGQEAGGLTVRRGHLPDGRILGEMRMLIQIKRSNLGIEDVFRIEQNGLELTDADGRPLAALTKKVEAGVAETTECVYSADKVAVVQEGPGGTYKHSFDLPADHAGGQQVATALVAAWSEGTQPQRAYSMFDAESLRFKQHTSTLLGKTTYEHAGTKHAGWHVRDVDDQKVVAESKLGEDFLPFEMRFMGGVFLAQWVDEPVQGAGANALTLTSFLSVDRAVDKMLLLESLEMRVVLDPPLGEDDPPLFEDGPYQTVEADPAGLRLVLHAQRVPADAASLAFPMEPDDPAVARHLAANARAQSDHAEVLELAKQIVGDAKNAALAVQRIVGWVWAQVEKVSGARGNATALEVLRSKRGDCTEHAVLVVALCRAVGIPARAVNGIEYLSSEKEAVAGFHAWSEVWLGRWTPVDATIPEIGTSARYVLFGYTEPGEPDSSPAMTALMSRKTRLEVVAWKHEGAERVEAPKAGTAEAAPAAAK